jgi:hypothetical protein
LLLLVVCLDAVAMWARMSESELLERSDLVVSGTLIGHSPVRTAGEDMVLAARRSRAAIGMASTPVPGYLSSLA